MTIDRYDNKQLDALVFALRSRILTDEEMADVESLGTELYMRWQHNSTGSYSAAVYRTDELVSRLNADLLQQFRLREERHRTLSVECLPMRNDR